MWTLVYDTIYAHQVRDIAVFSQNYGAKNLENI